MNKFKNGDRVIINKVYIAPYIEIPYEEIEVTILYEYVTNIYMVQFDKEYKNFSYNHIDCKNVRVIPSRYLTLCENIYEVDLL